MIDIPTTHIFRFEGLSMTNILTYVIWCNRPPHKVAAQWWLAHLRIPRKDFVDIPNIAPIYQELVSISPTLSHVWLIVYRIKYFISHDCATTKYGSVLVAPLQIGSLKGLQNHRPSDITVPNTFHQNPLDIAEHQNYFQLHCYAFFWKMFFYSE